MNSDVSGTPNDMELESTGGLKRTTRGIMDTATSDLFRADPISPGLGGTFSNCMWVTSEHSEGGRRSSASTTQGDHSHSNVRISGSRGSTATGDYEAEENVEEAIFDKPRWCLGYLPTLRESFPKECNTIAANVAVGLLNGLGMTLAMVVTAAWLFTSTPELEESLSSGISLMLYSAALGIIWTSLFGRLQYTISTPQDVVAVLWASMASKVSDLYRDEPQKVAPAIFILVALSTVLTGVILLLLGAAKVGKVMLMFPAPVTGGFLGAIGYYSVVSSFKIASGADWSEYFWPTNWSADDGGLFHPGSVARMACTVSFVFVLRNVPYWCAEHVDVQFLKKLWVTIFMLVPLPIFYLVVVFASIPLESIRPSWVYEEANASAPFYEMWTNYDFSMLDAASISLVWSDLLVVAFMSTLCSMLGLLGITAHFPSGTESDPNPWERIDYNHEILCIGANNLLIGATGGAVVFYRIGASIRQRADGGDYRLGLYVAGCFVVVIFCSSLPIAPYVPKFYLAGFQLHTGMDFLKGAFSGFDKYAWVDRFVTIVCIVVAAFSQSPVYGIFAGFGLAVILFLYSTSRTSPVKEASTGVHCASTEKRPEWEDSFLTVKDAMSKQAASGIVVLQLQGFMFFGTVLSLSDALADTLTQKTETYPLRFIILDFASVPYVDPSAADAFSKARAAASRRNVNLLFSGMVPKVARVLAMSGVIHISAADAIESDSVRMYLEDEKALHKSYSMVGLEGYMSHKTKSMRSFRRTAGPVDNLLNSGSGERGLSKSLSSRASMKHLTPTRGLSGAQLSASAIRMDADFLSTTTVRRVPSRRVTRRRSSSSTQVPSKPSNNCPDASSSSGTIPISDNADSDSESSSASSDGEGDTFAHLDAALYFAEQHLLFSHYYTNRRRRSDWKLDTCIERQYLAAARSHKAALSDYALSQMLNIEQRFVKQLRPPEDQDIGRWTKRVILDPGDVLFNEGSEPCLVFILSVCVFLFFFFLNTYPPPRGGQSPAKR
eukprot:TRINITY_DN908_c0_g1_i5.p1 TRINITY_DN908_c0_g1~~TRINITY_DN908_c0_g1_i5.p1  ORF type:complete len:1005 (+),score=129.05 TRINITY_DN908_c0_g1_i5:1404-4418(+)